MLDAAALKLRMRYDPETGEFVWLRPPAVHPRLFGKPAGLATPNRNKAYHVIQIDGVKHKRSRLAWLYMTGDWPAHQVDHISGDSLDDRWINLREATPTQNAWNHKGRAKAADLPMGVRKNAGGSFSARLAVNKQMLHLGAFETPGEASAAYLKAREVHYGEFA